MISNLSRQLAELGVEHLLGEVLKETALVRKEFGYPIMITPFSQLVVTQAMLNVTQGERYKTIPDEVIQFALGHYGKQPIPVDQNLMDRPGPVKKLLVASFSPTPARQSSWMSGVSKKVNPPL